jgi:DMSO/TMAO reductase YedYZ heme-binding membrane subunit
MIRFETLRYGKRSSLRDAALIFSAGVLASMLVAGMMALAVGWLVNTNVAQAILEQLLPAGATSAWYLSRASGIVAYLFVSLSVIWGLALSTKIVKEWVAAPFALALHNTCSWMAIGLATFHAGVLLFDGYFNYSIPDLLIPFTGPYRPASVGLGIISLYGLFLIASSFCVRKRIGQRTWRRLHFTSFVLYVLVTAHGITAGSDSQTPVLQAIYVGSTLCVLFLVNYRLLLQPKGNTARLAHLTQNVGRSIPGAE